MLSPFFDLVGLKLPASREWLQTACCPIRPSISVTLLAQRRPQLNCSQVILMLRKEGQFFLLPRKRFAGVCLRPIHWLPLVPEYCHRAGLRLVHLSRRLSGRIWPRMAYVIQSEPQPIRGSSGRCPAGITGRHETEGNQGRYRKGAIGYRKLSTSMRSASVLSRLG